MVLKTIHIEKVRHAACCPCCNNVWPAAEPETSPRPARSRFLLLFQDQVLFQNTLMNLRCIDVELVLRLLLLEL